LVISLVILREQSVYGEEQEIGVERIRRSL
jgi:hypothetical protein